MTYTIKGYIATFERKSNLLTKVIRGRTMKFFEKVSPGAFKRSLDSNKNIDLLINHEGKPIASTSNGTLRLWENNIGLAYEADITDQEVIRDLKKGAIEGCSFSFIPIKEKSEEMKSMFPIQIRTLEDVKLTHVSLIKVPSRSAYVGTTVELSEYRTLSNLVKKELDYYKYKY